MPLVMDFHSAEGTETGLCSRGTRDRDSLAPPGVPIFLDMEIPKKAGWEARKKGGRGVDPPNGSRASKLRIPTHPRQITLFLVKRMSENSLILCHVPARIQAWRRTAPHCVSGGEPIFSISPGSCLSLREGFSRSVQEGSCSYGSFSLYDELPLVYSCFVWQPL